MPTNEGNLDSIAAGIGLETYNRVKFGAGGTTGAVGNFTIFNVTGTVAVKLYAVCEADLASSGGGSIEAGTSKTTAGLIAQTTATDIDEDEIWHDATPDASVEAVTVVAEKIVNDDIIVTIGTGAVTAGTIKFIAIWKPISRDGSLESTQASFSASPSISPSASTSSSASLSPSASRSPSSSVSPSSSASASLSPSSSLSPSASLSPSSSTSASLSPSSSASASVSPSASTSPSSSASPSISPSSSASASASPSISPSSSVSPSPSPSPL